MNFISSDRNGSIVGNKIVFVYFVSILVITLWLTDPHGLLNETYRIGLLLLTICPIFVNKSLFAGFLTSTLCISLASFCPLLPTSSEYYIILVPLVSVFLIKTNFDDIAKSAVPMIIYFFIVEIIYSGTSGGMCWVIIALFFVGCIKDKTDSYNMTTALMFSSIGICLIYLFFAKYFMVKIVSDEMGGYERSQWLNPNELAGMINCGGIIAAAYLTGFVKSETNGKLLRLIEIVTIILVGVVNIINASRGGILIFLFISALFVLLSNVKKKIKIIIIIAFLIMIVYAINNGLAETLIYRLNEESLGNGNERTNIWQTKLNLFFSILSPIEMLFGIGFKNTILLGNSQGVSTHNDFVTSLVAYGFIGLFLYIRLFYMILKTTPRGYRVKSAIFILFLILESSSLEYFFRGYLVLLIFTFFIPKLFTFSQDTKQR